MGATYGGQKVGTFGDLATVSFYPAHHITMGEGGCVLAEKPLLKTLVESFRDWGRDCWCEPGKENTCGKRFDWQLGELALRLRSQVHVLAYRLQPEDDRYAGGGRRFAAEEAAGVHRTAPREFRCAVRRVEGPGRVLHSARSDAEFRAELVRISDRRPERCAVQPQSGDRVPRRPEDRHAPPVWREPAAAARLPGHPASRGGIARKH